MTISKAFRKVLWSVAILVSLACTTWGFLSYSQYQERARLSKNKTPFAEVVALAIADGEDVLRQRGLIRPSSPARVACGLDIEMCGKGLVRKFAIDDTGSVLVQLAGGRNPALDGKFVLLVPRIEEKIAKWTCMTDAPAELVPSKEDNMPGLLLVPCDFGKPNRSIQPTARGGG